jgi:hypothetical protein
MNRSKIITLVVTGVLVIAILVGAELGKTQKTILTPGMVNKYTDTQSEPSVSV